MLASFNMCISLVPVSIACSAVGISEVEITCEGVEPSVLLQCSFSGGPLHPCTILVILDHNLELCAHNMHVQDYAELHGV